ncbi:MAG TPA: winged helix-turn-helix domain-containing protein [Xanthobacteraceae bacterium]|nr:winged helix-turn-helix domain-containing protein [Xanthobacteraceae bacterium]
MNSEERNQLDALIEKLNNAAAVGDALAAESASAIVDLIARVRPDDLVSVNLFTNLATRGLKTVKLSPSEASLLYRMTQSHPKSVTLDELYVAVYGRTLKRNKNTVRVLLKGLRSRAAELHITITNTFGTGYRLELHPLPPHESVPNDNPQDA